MPDTAHTADIAVFPERPESGEPGGALSGARDDGTGAIRALTDLHQRPFPDLRVGVLRQIGATA